MKAKKEGVETKKSKKFHPQRFCIKTMSSQVRWRWRGEKFSLSFILEESTKTHAADGAGFFFNKISFKIFFSYRGGKMFITFTSACLCLWACCLTRCHLQFRMETIELKLMTVHYIVYKCQGAVAVVNNKLSIDISWQFFSTYITMKLSEAMKIYLIFFPVKKRSLLSIHRHTMRHKAIMPYVTCCYLP